MKAGRKKLFATPVDPYQEFLAEQKKREAQWCEETKAKKARNEEKEAKSFSAGATAEDVASIKLLVQESICKMMEKFEDALFGVERKITVRLGRIEQRLDSLEQNVMIQQPETEQPLSASSILQQDDLQTIDSVALASLNEDMDIFALSPETPTVPTPPTASTSSTPATQSFHELTEAQVGDELIGSCVTPRKLPVVKNILQSESERHKYALKLLPYFFTKDEMSTSNTDGTHQKLPLDTTKLNSLKVLVFSRFPVESSAERDKAWKFIKGKINAKCRLSKHIIKQAGDR